MQELIKAIRKGDLALVNQALEKLSYKVDFSKNIFGNTILHIAASSGNEKVFKLLLGLEGSNINITNKSGNTVLHSAVLYNHQEIVKEIFKYTGKDFINVANGDKQTALYYAADYKMLDTLIKAGAEFNIKDKDGISPLTNFAYKGDIASVKLLLEKKAEVTEETLEKAVYGLVRGQENISGSMEVLKILKSQFKKSELDEISQKLKKEYGKEYAYSTVEIILASEKESHFTSLSSASTSASTSESISSIISFLKTIPSSASASTSASTSESISSIISFLKTIPSSASASTSASTSESISSMTIPKYEKNPYILISDTDSTGLKTIEIDLVGADKEEESSSS